MPPLNLHEYDYNLGVAKKVRAYSQIECEIFLRDNKTISALGEEVNEWAMGENSCAIELHFNWFDEKSAQGTLTLYDMVPPNSIDLAQMVQKSVCDVFDRKKKDNRGCNWVKLKDRGYYNLSAISIPACIIEPGFGSSYYDSGLLKEREDSYARCLAETAKEFLFNEGDK